MKRLLTALCLLSLTEAACPQDLTTVWGPRASFQATFRVVDDAGSPVEGAKFSCSWGRLGFSAPDAGQVDLFTDRDGEGVVKARSVFNEFNYHAEMPGHYSVHSVGYDRPIFRERVSGRWQPWNPTVNLTLKRVRNPIAMYVKRLETRIPARGTPVGYDLEIGDWVEPYGKGRTDDLVVTSVVEQRGDRDFDWELKILCPNAGDGLQRFDPGPSIGGSELRSPYEAPAGGYISEWTLHRSRRPDSAEKSTFRRDGGYFLRVRTVLDAQGNVVKAWYGKIYGDFFDMVYYLNPDGTRNVEFDPQRNLFPHDDRDRAFRNLGP